ncbi:penicillin-binding protein 2 [Candidatus Nomurabacteria bacterium]|nr:penicillin-binding protein 2 [Candidatus Nomurabacteria bacterium]
MSASRQFGAARFALRVRLIAGLLIVIALVIIGRLYLVQIVHGEEYARKADAQLSIQKDPLLNRGSIYMTSKDGERVVAATLRPIDESSEDEHQRYYPGGSLAAQTLGFVAYNNDDEQKGRYGLERYYEQTLARPGEELYKNFFVELFGGIRDVLSDTPSHGDIITTIEPTVQSELERALVAYEESWTPKLAGGIVMDPNTGEIVAMALSPTFDLNYFNKQESTSIFANAMAESVFEMGSIMKPLTVAAGLDAGVITEATTYNDTGCVEMDQKRFCNHDLVARGPGTTMQQVLSESLNLGASFVAGKLEPEEMRHYFIGRYKFGQETGVDLPGELRGLTQNLLSNRQIEHSTASFGQGLAVTPIQMVRALATLGNGGYLVTPHLVRAVRDESGLERPLGWGEPERVLKQETSTAISRMLTEVVDEALVDGKIKLERHSVAAKTGTAQIANPGGGGYYADRYLHSFFGYFPSFDPRFIVFLFAEEPQGAAFSSQTWAMPFHTLTEFLINYYNIPPDR